MSRRESHGAERRARFVQRLANGIAFMFGGTRNRWATLSRRGAICLAPVPRGQGGEPLGSVFFGEAGTRPAQFTQPSRQARGGVKERVARRGSQKGAELTEGLISSRASPTRPLPPLGKHTGEIVVTVAKKFREERNRIRARGLRRGRTDTIDTRRKGVRWQRGTMERQGLAGGGRPYPTRRRGQRMPEQPNDREGEPTRPDGGAAP